MGYHHAGFRVIGIDHKPQPRYPFRFAQGDALTILSALLRTENIAAIHASPPCKTHTSLKPFSSPDHVDILPETRAALIASGLPYVIENVPGAPMINPTVLCGSMFKLGVRRHRLFETNWGLTPLRCRHAEQRAASPMYAVKDYHTGTPVVRPSPVIGVYGRGQGLGPGEVGMWRHAMGISWMTQSELSQAIPPAYTRYIGTELMRDIMLSWLRRRGTPRHQTPTATGASNARATN